MKRLIYILPAIGFVVLAVVLYRSLFMAPTILPSALINRPAPRLTLPALDAQTQGFGPKELAAGHVTVVNVFASWCIPCHVEAPVLMLWGKYDPFLSLEYAVWLARQIKNSDVYIMDKASHHGEEEWPADYTAIVKGVTGFVPMANNSLQFLRTTGLS